MRSYFTLVNKFFGFLDGAFTLIYVAFSRCKNWILASVSLEIFPSRRIYAVDRLLFENYRNDVLRHCKNSCLIAIFSIADTLGNFFYMFVAKHIKYLYPKRALSLTKLVMGLLLSCKWKMRCQRFGWMYWLSLSLSLSACTKLESNLMSNKVFIVVFN